MAAQWIARAAIDAVVLLHLAFILFAIFGALLQRWWPLVLWLHLPALAWGVWIEIGHGLCPLTTLENRLRSQAGQQGYEDGFIAHYLLPMIYPSGLSQGQQLVLALLLALFNLAIYARIWRHRSTIQ